MTVCSIAKNLPLFGGFKHVMNVMNHFEVLSGVHTPGISHSHPQGKWSQYEELTDWNEL
jgi:hypothetical protein